MATLTAPGPVTVSTYFGNLHVVFRDGVAEVDDAAISDGHRAYWAANGYTLTTKPKRAAKTPPEPAGAGPEDAA